MLFKKTPEFSMKYQQLEGVGQARLLLSMIYLRVVIGRPISRQNSLRQGVPTMSTPSLY